MSLQMFVDKGGFKMLAVARLSPGSYALVCYLCNCLAAGVEEVVSSVGELSVLLGIPERHARLAVEELADCRIILLTRSEGRAQGGKTFAARLNLDPDTWQNLRKESGSGGRRRRTPLGDARNVHPLLPQSRPPSGHEPGLRDVTHEGLRGREGGGQAPLPTEPGEKAGKGGRTANSGAPGSSTSVKGRAEGEGEGDGGLSPQEALIFPAGRKPHGQGSPGKKASLVQDGNAPDDREAHLESTAVGRVLGAFGKSKEGKIDEEKERSYASLLCENHPVEQIVALIEAFGREIPSLGLLAGAWMHYSERFHHLEKEEISLEAYRKKNEGMERKLRQLAAAELKRAQSLKVTLSADEELLLRIFMRHEHPRRQLYWALQVRERYPHLQDFFGATAHMALRTQR